MRDQTKNLITDWLIGYPPGTRNGYGSDVATFQTWLELGLAKDLLEATRADIQRWLGNLIENGYQPTTVRRKASAVWSLFNYAVEERILEHNPAEHLRRPKGDSAPKRGLPVDQAQALINAAKAHSRPAHALVWLMVGAGLRVAEACSACIEDLDDNLLTVIVKGGHRQTKPLSPPVLEAVMTAIANREKGTILTNRDNNSLSRQRAQELIDRLTTSVGIEKCTPHTLRHTAATLALEAGVPLEDVAALLGHRQLETTLRYIQDRDIAGATRAAANRLGQVLTEARG